MTNATIIDGKKIAQELREEVHARVEKLRSRNITPRLEVILVGDNPASLIYVENKQRAAREAGIVCTIHRFPETAAEAEILKKIESLNVPDVHGILLQLPVPKQINAVTLLNRIAPERDVDGLTYKNVGLRAANLPSLLPCTPKGCLKLIKSVQPDLAGLNALVVGRSDLVGKPMAQLLQREDCTLAQAHLLTRGLPALCQWADILVVAIGDPQFIKGEWIKPGAIVIDVGINRVNGKIVGDVDFASASKVAKAITPVPGGVGPMTIACLLENTVEAAEKA
jgi:methylenetetrahydrofolate dehydrogenase (NADP+)/methenyltetrahydrofolate cyclohydrolase